MATAITQDYQSIITAKIAPTEASNKISQVSKWWSLNFEGSSKPGDVFTVRFKNGDRYEIKVEELIPGKKIVWDVIDADQTWHEDRDEWTGTKIICDISPDKNGSKVTMTHLGLVPEFECYDRCKLGWDYLLKESLYKYLSEGTGMPV